ncbi:sugar phosphate isomerase/epimerase [Pseudarthrobacter sp. LMD1-1-1.1]
MIRASKQATRFRKHDRFGRLAATFNEVGAIAQRAGISFGLHTESHSMMWLERDIELFMLATDPFYVGLCLDAAHITLGGGDPVAVAEKYIGRLVSSHWKDATATMPWSVPIDKSVHVAHREFCRVPGQGIVDWKAWASVMDRAGLTYPALIEVDAIATPVTQIQKAVAFLSPILDQLDLTPARTPHD